MATDDDLASAATAASGPGTTAPPLAAASPPPSVIADRYEILGLLGAGGMGRVYRAHDRTLDETVALKMLRRELLDTPGVLERFRQEVKLARRVTSPHVVRTFDLGQHGDDHYLTMEYIDGRSLAQQLDDGPMAFDEVVRIARAAAAGIAAAHANGVLHRDLKPDNVLVGKTGRIVITDFGIACAATLPVATVDRFAGTPAYMAPEQVEAGAEIGPATDVYAFGAIVFEMLTGRRPFPGTDVIQVAIARLREPPPDPRTVRRVPDALAELTLRCMARAPRDRLADGAALVAALAALGDHSAVERTQPGPRAVPAKTARSVAILPMRAGDGLAEVADGLAEEIVDALSMTRALRVRPLASVRKAATADADAREVGAALGVDVVIDGSIRRRGDQVRISARVIGVADGFQLWASHFDARSEALLAASDDVVRAVARALTVDLDMPARAAGDARATELYLAAKARLRAQWLDADLEPLIVQLEEAHALAPDDAAIVATLATALARSGFYHGGDRALARARELAQRATAAAPELGEAWFARGVSSLYSGAPADAVTALVSAVHRTPGFAMAQAMLGAILLEAGALDHALLHLEAASSLDPGGLAHIDLPRAYVYAGRWDEAMHELGLAQRDPTCRNAAFDHVWIARFKLWRGELAAIAPGIAPTASPRNVTEYAEALSNVHRTGVLAGANRERLAALTKASNPRLRASRAQFMAEYLMFFGEPDEAVHWIAASVDSGLQDHLWFERCPLLAPLRGRTDYDALAARVRERSRAVIAALEAAT